MLYGVKVIHIQEVGKAQHRFYEELILTVNARSYDEAYEKAERYMQDAVCNYVNIYGECVKTVQIEATDCFLAFDPENDVQEVYASCSRNCTELSEKEYYRMMTACCEEKELSRLRNAEYN
ncbi:MAG: DUF4288 domain-containing protein [Clostridia bacterium]|nr:DUF4288 domain-containing protein [Clostridia bacterium]